MKRMIQVTKMAAEMKKIPFVKLDNLVNVDKEFKPKSIADLKIKIKEDELIPALKVLMEKLVKCDVDPQIVFSIRNSKGYDELLNNTKELLNPYNSRKYDENARHILHVIRFLLSTATIKPRFR